MCGLTASWSANLLGADVPMGLSQTNAEATIRFTSRPSFAEEKRSPARSGPAITARPRLSSRARLTGIAWEYSPASSARGADKLARLRLTWGGEDRTYRARRATRSSRTPSRLWASPAATRRSPAGLGARHRRGGRAQERPAVLADDRGDRQAGGLPHLHRPRRRHPARPRVGRRGRRLGVQLRARPEHHPLPPPPLQRRYRQLLPDHRPELPRPADRRRGRGRGVGRQPFVPGPPRPSRGRPSRAT